jgi:hypothetical protein
MLLLPSPCSRIMDRRKRHVTRLGPERVLVAAGIPCCAGREWQQAYPAVREENGSRHTLLCGKRRQQAYPAVREEKAAGIPCYAGREWQQAYPAVREEKGGVDDASMDDSHDP